MGPPPPPVGPPPTVGLPGKSVGGLLTSPPNPDMGVESEERGDAAAPLPPRPSFAGDIAYAAALAAHADACAARAASAAASAAAATVVA